MNIVCSSEGKGLRIQTRGNSNPHGKPKVYFTCHPKDLGHCFEEIADDIFETQDCVICYRDPELEYSKEELREFITDGMQLFVIAVTERLLEEPNQAMDVEFPLALEHHIPILPLLQEEGLDEKYAGRFGALQYLDKGNKDLTAIGFDEKLKGFLDSVLVGEREAEMVRRAFDAYVFLSYRKKDREAAQELMRFIHRNDRYRDIAIWYDEFLVPGKSFSESINSMLRRSRLFLLAVTPNIVNEENYVQQVEYPEARSQGRPILPAEVRKLNGKELELLEEGYPEIPALVDPSQEEAFFAELERKLKGVALGENSGDAMHNFCIGLAYLKGIDVETDHDKAVSLITGAARKKLPVAVQKLARMYEKGDGVARNFDEASHWWYQLVAIRMDEYGKKRDSDTGWELYVALRNLEKIYKISGDIPKAVNTCEAAALLAEGTDYPWSANGAVDALLDRGYYEFEKQDFLKADGFYQRAEAGLRHGGDSDTAAILQERRSILARRQGDMEKAESHLLEALRIREELAKDEPVAYRRSAIALSWLLLGDLRNKSCRPGARECYRRALALYEVLAEETRTVRDRDGLEVCYCALAETSDNADERVQCYRRALDILTDLVEETGYRQLALKKAICELNLTGRLVVPADEEHPEGQVIELPVLGGRTDRPSGASMPTERAARESAPRSGLPEGQMSMADLRQTALLNLQLAQQFAEQGKRLHARNHYLHAAENICGIDERNWTVRDLLILYHSYVQLGVGFREQGDKAQAAQYWEKAFDANTRLIEQDPDDLGHFNAAGISSQWAGVNYLEAGNGSAALRCYRAGLEQIREGEAKTGKVFLHCDMEGRVFDCFRAEACYRIAQIEGEDPVANRADIANMTAECAQALVDVFNRIGSEERLFDVANGVYLCALCMAGADRAKHLGMADSLCSDSLANASDRARFLELQRQIRAAK